ncbi:MAG: DEAD/DEAH box helicase [Thermoguttaceae bacterium]
MTMTPKKSPRGNRGKRNNSKARDDFRWGFVGDDDNSSEASASAPAESSPRAFAAPNVPSRPAAEPNRLDESEISEFIVTPTGFAGLSKRKQRAAERRTKSVSARSMSTSSAPQTPSRDTKSPRAPQTPRGAWANDDESLALPSYGRGLIGDSPSRKTDVVVLTDSDLIATMTPDATPSITSSQKVASDSKPSRRSKRSRKSQTTTALPTTASPNVATPNLATVAASKPARRETPPKPAASKVVPVAEPVAAKPARRLPPGLIPEGLIHPKMVWDRQKREYVPVAETPVVAEKPKRERTRTPRTESPAREPKPESRRESRREPKPEPTSATVHTQTDSTASALDSRPTPSRGQALRGNDEREVNRKPPREPKPESRREPKPESKLESSPSPPASRPSPPRRKPAAMKSDVVAADAEAEPTGFAALGLSPDTLAALKVVRYLEPTPIQKGVLASVLAGRDVMGQARTGTGKTAAFLIPLLEMMSRTPRTSHGPAPRAMVLVPTRELAVQVRDEAARLCYGRDIIATACYGGKPLAKQLLRLRDGADIVIGTPGRVLDLMARRALVVSELQWIVLDEADRMLDIGFRPDIEKILRQVPKERQTLLFSATLPAPVVKLAERYMRDPEVLDFSEKDVAVDTIEQFYVTIDPERKFDALVKLIAQEKPTQAIVFCRTKRGVDKLARHLERCVASVAVIHGDLAQTVRDRVMTQFRSGAIKVLVATDVVGRGIDVSGISHIINYDIPAFCDDYVHRVGRTGRMGREGVAFTFVTTQEGQQLTRIEMRINKLLKRANLEGFESFTKPTDDTASDADSTAESKPVYGKKVRKIRRAL